MDLRESIESYKRQFEGGVEVSGGELRAAALDVLQEFLGDYAALQSVEALTVGDLEEFFVDWYLRRPGAAAEVALPLLDTVRGWLLWSDSEHGGRLGEQFEPLYQRLRVDLPRILQAWHAIARRLRQSRREDEEEAGLAGIGALPATSLISSGINRVLRPEEIDYGEAREDYFRVEQVEPASLVLQSPSGGELGEEAIGPVQVPPAAATHLRPGDILYVEVAPGRKGWEILEISQALPGGYASARTYYS